MYCFLFNTIIINIVILLINYYPEVTAKNVINKNGNDNTIRILLRKPQPFEKQYSEENLEALNSRFITSNTNNTLLNNYKLEFHYCNDDNKAKKGYPEDNQKSKETSVFLKDTEYVNYIQCIVDSSYSFDYDILLLDDRFLFSDTSLIENIRLEEYFHFRHLYKNYLNLTSYINSQEIEYHNPRVVKDGKLDEYSLYGLPFELDFDLLYYHDEVQKLENLSPPQLTWENLLDPNFPNNSSNGQAKYPSLLDLPVGDNNELINIFIEYFSDKRDLTTERKQKNANYFDKSKTNDDLYHSFRNFVKNTSSSDMKEILTHDYQKVFSSFINKETKTMEGKASHFAYLKSFPNITVSSTLPPKYYSVITEKYLVINRHSQKDEKVLVEAVKQLTSKEMQLYRAQTFDNIPTLDVSRDDPDVINYCTTHAFFCKAIQQMESIHIKSMFKKTKFSITFMEIRLLLPYALKRFLIDGNVEAIAITFDNIMNVKLYNIGTPNVYFVILYMIMGLFSISMVVILVMIYRNREHPHLKVVSPMFCKLALIGLISNSFTPVFLTHITSPVVCKFIYMHGIVSRTLIFMPLFAVVLRIFCIYTNKSKVNFGKKLEDKTLLIGIVTILLLGIVLGSVIMYIREFYVITLGNITEQIALRCFHEGTLNHIYFGFAYYSVMFISMIVMVLKSGKLKRKYDEIKIIFLIILLLVGAALVEVVMLYTPTSCFLPHFLAIYCIYIIICFVCIYLLVGSRLLFIMKHPYNKDTMDENDPYYHEYFNNNIHISDFIDKKQKKTMPLFNQNINQTKNKKKKSMKKNGTSTSIDNDPIANNPNNYFFNQSLEMLKQPEV